VAIKEEALFEAAASGHSEVVKSICIMSFGMNVELKHEAMGPALFGALRVPLSGSARGTRVADSSPCS